MPTPSRAAVAAARSLALSALEEAGPGAVSPYPDLARGVEAACGLAPRRARHALRAAVDALAGEGRAKLWGRRLRDGRWVVTWLRAPGRRGTLPAPPARERWRPPKPYKGAFHAAPELLALAERTILALLADPPCEAEHLLAANLAPPPGPGWVSYHWVTSRCGLALRGRLNPQTRLNVIGVAVRSLAGKGVVALRARPTRDGKRKVRWVKRLADGAADTPQPVPAPPVGRARLTLEPSRL